MSATTATHRRLTRTDRFPTELAARLAGLGQASELVYPDGHSIEFGSGPPRFRIVLRTGSALTIRATELDIAGAYVNGDIDFEGDMLELLDLRDSLVASTTIGQKLKFAFQLLLPPTAVNPLAIESHYERGDDFFLSFLDREHRIYSQCLFRDEADTLEIAAERKLATMWSTLGLEPGMRVLDVGGGWGGVAEYCGRRGVHVTTLTLAPGQKRFVWKLLNEEELPGDVMLVDALEYVPDRSFDHVVMFGVIEHLPNYHRLARRAWTWLRPGGRVYIDGSACLRKFGVSAVTRRYTWRGHHSFMSLPDTIEALLHSGFDIVDVARETEDYRLTMEHWARRFDRAHETIADGWGEAAFRAHRMFLWGGAHAFRANRLQAYHLVAERNTDLGPRPGGLSRFTSAVLALR